MRIIKGHKYYCVNSEKQIFKMTKFQNIQEKYIYYSKFKNKRKFLKNFNASIKPALFA